MFREIIRLIVCSFFPNKCEILLGFLILEPIVSHVDGFGAALLELFVDEINRCRVI